MMACNIKAHMSFSSLKIDISSRSSPVTKAMGMSLSTSAMNKPDCLWKMSQLNVFSLRCFYRNSERLIHILVIVFSLL